MCSSTTEKALTHRSGAPVQIRLGEALGCVPARSPTLCGRAGLVLAISISTIPPLSPHLHPRHPDPRQRLLGSGTRAWKFPSHAAMGSVFDGTVGVDVTKMACRARADQARSSM